MKRSKMLSIISLAVVLSILAIAIPVIPVMANVGVLSVSPSSGAPGTSVTISGGQFTAGTTYTVSFDLYNSSSGAITSTGIASGSVDQNGSFVTFYTIPSQPAGSSQQTPTGQQAVGVYYFRATTTAPTPDTSNPVQFQITPTISLSTSTARVGDQINVGGRGFKQNSAISLYFDSTAITLPVSDNNGMFSSTFNVPEAAQGKHTIYGSDQQFSSPKLDFTINPKLTVNPTATSVGATITASGTGFTAFSTITFTVDNVSSSTVATATNLGSFSNIQLTIPVVSAGNHTLKAADNSGFSDTTTITTSQSFSINPTTGPADTVITLSGGGFTARKNIIITFNNAPAATTPPTVTSDDSGNFKSTIAAPKGAAKTYTINVTDGTVTSTANFTITATAKIDQTTGAVGSSIPVTGNGFNANTDITVQYDGAGVGTTKSGADGSFSANFTVPPGPAGQHKITITDGVNTINANFTTTAAAQISGPNGSGTQTGGYVGSEITVKGSAFVRGAPVTVTYDSTPVATATVSTDGSFTASFKAPISKGGNHTVVVSDGTNKTTFTYVMDSTPPPAPTLTAPAKDANVPALPNLQWSSVSDPSGVTYTLQIAHDAGFNSVIIQKTGLTTPGYQLTDQEKLDSTGKDKPYYWRVKAIDAASNESPWSTALTFTVGYIFPTWILYFLIAVGAVIVFGVGFFVGRRTNR